MTLNNSPAGRCVQGGESEERMSWLTRVSLRNRSVVVLAVIGVLVLGLVSTLRLRQELMPSIEYPALTVFTMQPGASPADVERGVTLPLETGMKGLVGLKELDSYSVSY